jgi:hypothetical protein
MSLLKILKSNPLFSEQIDVPKQYLHIKVPGDEVIFQAKMNIAEMPVVEVEYKNSGYKEQYVLNPDLITLIDRKAYRIKMLHIIKTEDSELKCITLPLSSKNSWHISNLELLTLAEKSPVIAKRDTNAKVYEAHMTTSISPIIITDEDIEQAYLNAFDMYEINSINHPALIGKIKCNSTADVVDESQTDLLHDTTEVLVSLSGYLEDSNETEDAEFNIDHQLDICNRNIFPDLVNVDIDDSLTNTIDEELVFGLEYYDFELDAMSLDDIKLEEAT